MSKQYPGGIISKTPPVPTQSAASGVWTLDQQAYWQKLGQWPAPPNLISRSLRFNSADTTYLNRTPATATNRRTWTWSAWVKRSALGTVQELFDGYWANTDNGYFWVGFTSADAFEVQLYNSTLRTTTQVFRDPSAWYHFVLAVDTTQATAANRVKVYVNGSEITAFSTNNAPTQNLDTAVNYNGAHYIGTFSGTTNLFNGYMTEVNLIDGQALTPSSFGYTDANTGVWTTLRYTGTYGTNGFYLNFSDNSNTTAATLGADYSGNGNNWTPNNFSVTAGAGNDSLVDSPTSYGTDTGVGGSVRGNYATLNPLNATGASAANGNLDVTLTSPGSTIAQIRGTIAPTSGKWYWESTITTDGNQSTQFGIVSAATASNISLGSGQSVNQVIYNRYDGTKTVNGTNSSYGSSYTTGDVIGVALDLDGNTITFYKNNTSQGSISLPTTGIAYAPVYWWSSSTSAGAATYNFGQRAFAYTAPSGFKALCTQNLPTPTIGATSATLATQFFAPVIYTGDGTNNRTITTGLQSDFVWIKRRDSATGHLLFDVIRGAGKTLRSQAPDTESDNGSYYVQQFNSNNFYMGTTDTAINASGGTYVSWVWKANSTGASNTAGTITSTVSASTTSGFSVATYTGNGTGGATVGHGLGAVPQMMIIKCRSTAYNWRVYHVSVGNVNSLLLNLNDAAASLSSWNSTTPTSTVFSLGTDVGTNQNTQTYVAYCFAPVAGYSAFGKYTGNGSADGPFVFTGFRPAFVMVKTSSVATQDWYILDSARDTYNLTANKLFPNSSNAENAAPNNSTSNALDFLSNGFKLKTTNDGTNQNAGTYIYMAVAFNPFKYSLAR